MLGLLDAKLLRQIERELKKAKHCAIYEEELNRVWPDDGISANLKSRDLRKTTGFACGSIVTVMRDFDREPREGSENSHQTLLDR